MLHPAVKKYMSRLGQKGGSATGPRKSRGIEHYKKMGRLSAQARKARKESENE